MNVSKDRMAILCTKSYLHLVTFVGVAFNNGVGVCFFETQCTTVCYHAHCVAEKV